MRNHLKLLLVIVLFVSCKKNDDVQLRFTPTLVGQTGIIAWDSIDYTTINYSFSTELNTPEDINNPDIYNHSVSLDIRKDYISSGKGQPIIIKKFDIISKSGYIMFYIPYEGQPGADKINMKLPLTMLMKTSMNLSINLVRYPKQ
jgi:hypothetical protein